MAWEWSHTGEAYENARANMQDMDPTELRIIWAEWKAAEPRGDGGFGLNTGRYETALAEAQVLGPVRLAADIWRQMEAVRTCTNGGHYAYTCPFGCTMHLVSFDREDPVCSTEGCGETTADPEGLCVHCRAERYYCNECPAETGDLDGWTTDEDAGVYICPAHREDA